MNPLLEENLGRWAQVYFTNPPEKRDRAVMDLLRELENRSTGSSGMDSPFPEENAEQSANMVSCAVCSRENRDGQKFCGHCGSPLRAQGWEDAPAAEDREPLSFSTAAAAPANGSEPPSFLGLSSTPQNELESLREKSYNNSYYESETHSGRRIFLTLLLIIVLGGVAYFNWPLLRSRFATVWQSADPRQQSHLSAAPSSVPPQAETTQPAATATASSAATAPPSTIEPATPAAKANGTQPQTASALPPAPAENSAANHHHAGPGVTLASKSQSSHMASDGSQELLQAQRYLKGGPGQANSAEAARWLWKSVSKKNSHAEVLLADLYARGDGVSKNCDEARILLGAAARKGSSEAAQKLRTIDCR